ncbi:MAG TPA: 4-alpha-glucanotransferase, partial [Rectinemataceae bacterium]|nr:4-alpha-glucanotransferase [Rectinemataceae bacterium]
MRFAHDDHSLSGLAVPLSSLRSASSPGCGEYPDLAAMGDLASSWGMGLVQLLPVNDTGSQTSPYSALSAFALHPLYIRITELPEIRPAAAKSMRAEALALVDRFRDAEAVPHEELLVAKLELLWRVWEHGGQASRADLDRWIQANPWVRAYAAFVELKRRNGGKPWWEWPSLVEPSPAELEALWSEPDLASALAFWAWLQMRAEGQFQAAASHLASLGVELMGDIPILMNRDSADVWSRRGVFDLDLVAGAPPDMYAELGQNWGFPIYDWKALEEEGYGFWVDRLREADKYYSCYRIDHVLGFFRIWSIGQRASSGYLGRFVPEEHITRAELEGLGFDSGRIRWLSRPHVRLSSIEAACGPERDAVIAAHFDRIGSEELFLFKAGIEGELDFGEAATRSGRPLSGPCLDFLGKAWRDRALYEFEPGCFAPAWRYYEASSWPSLSEAERGSLEALFAGKRAASERLWADTGRRLLGILCEAVPMLPCAEDLGAVPDCVPLVLGELGILGLRVLRWTRLWRLPGQPYQPLSEYPRLTVATPSVHDSSSLRGWWQTEANREQVWSFFEDCLGRRLGPCPSELDPHGVAVALEAIARSKSRFAVYPIQDLIA